MTGLKKHVFLYLYLCSAILGLVIKSSPSHAQEQYTALTEENITDFIQRTTGMTSNMSTELSAHVIISYLDEHLHRHARFKTTMKYNIPGMPEQSTVMSLDKKEFMESVESGAETVSEYRTEVAIENIQISRDKTKATVETSSYESGTMPVEIENSTEHIPIEGQSNCTQILTLDSKKGIIQMYNANCTTVIRFVAH